MSAQSWRHCQYIQAWRRDKNDETEGEAGQS